MEVFLANEQEHSIDEARLSSLARHVLDAEEIDDSAELSVLLVTSDHIKTLNARYAGDDYATDVLAFPMMEEEDDEAPTMLGDIVICPEVARTNADKLNHSLDREVDVLLIHGLLHLLGYDHQNDEERARMDKRLEQILHSFSNSTI
jgi:probable rRNA maturation factor